jgi:hypothetical protein
MIKACLSFLIAVALFATGCTKPLSEPSESIETMGKKDDPVVQPSPVEEDASEIIVDCSKEQGKIMNMTIANGTSTSSPLPGEASRVWLQGLNTKVTRVWIQLVFVYNNGNINYNYRYEGSRVPVEDALSFYSTTSDSLLICLSGHRNSGSRLVPVGEAYKDFVRDLILHYKRKFPKIKYIQVTNEPDAGDETMATYYPVYRNYYRGLNEANAVLGQEAQDSGYVYDPIKLSNGAFTSNVPNMLDYAHDFFNAYVADPDPSKKLDFFTFHSYGESNRPKELLTARQRIDSAMRSHGLPVIPVFLSEYGMVGGSSLPAGLTLAQTVTMQPAGQLTKAYYLYEGGIDKIFNWTIHHSSIVYKSEILDIANGIRSPYGNALELSRMLADRKKRVEAVSKSIDPVGLGLHAVAAEGNNKGVAVLLWNYNWRTAVADRDIQVLIKNIPDQHFKKRKVNVSVYVIDSKNNNYFINPAQNTLQVTNEQVLDYQSYLKVPVRLERSSVALILLTPEKENNGN